MIYFLHHFLPALVALVTVTLPIQQAWASVLGARAVRPDKFETIAPCDVSGNCGALNPRWLDGRRPSGTITGSATLQTTTGTATEDPSLFEFFAIGVAKSGVWLSDHDRSRVDTKIRRLAEGRVIFVPPGVFDEFGDLWYASLKPADAKGVVNEFQAVSAIIIH